MTNAVDFRHVGCVGAVEPVSSAWQLTEYNVVTTIQHRHKAMPTAVGHS
eukprot:COSAG06_NODE_41223_length_393_cov_1.452381_1_plen_48_part_10